MGQCERGRAATREDLGALRSSFPTHQPTLPPFNHASHFGSSHREALDSRAGHNCAESEVQMESSSVTPAGLTICLLPTSVPPGWPSLEVLPCIEGCLVLPEMEDLSSAFLPLCFNIDDVFLSLTPTCSHGNGWTKDTAWPEVRQLG